jgi:hypothetical protein
MLSFENENAGTELRLMIATHKDIITITRWRPSISVRPLITIITFCRRAATPTPFRDFTDTGWYQYARPRTGQTARERAAEDFKPPMPLSL